MASLISTLVVLSGIMFVVGSVILESLKAGSWLGVVFAIGVGMAVYGLFKDNNAEEAVTWG